MSTPDPSESGVDVAGGQYVENPDHVPDPTAATGTLDTSGTAGAEDSRVENTTPVFDAARAQDLQYASKALDPDDDSVDDPGAVVIENKDGRTEEEAREAVDKAAEAVREDPVVVEDPTVQNAEESAADGTATDPAQVEAQQQQASPAGGTAKGSRRSRENPTAE